MTKFKVTLLGMAESRKFIKKYLDERVREVSDREVYGDHLLLCSELKWYVKASYMELEMEGHGQERLTGFCGIACGWDIFIFRLSIV